MPGRIGASAGSARIHSIYRFYTRRVGLRPDLVWPDRGTRLTITRFVNPMTKRAYAGGRAHPGNTPAQADRSVPRMLLRRGGAGAGGLRTEGLKSEIAQAEAFDVVELLLVLIEVALFIPDQVLE